MPLSSNNHPLSLNWNDSCHTKTMSQFRVLFMFSTICLQPRFTYIPSNLILTTLFLPPSTLLPQWTIPWTSYTTRDSTTTYSRSHQMRSQISGWWTDNHCSCHLSYYPSPCHILPPQPQAWMIPFLRRNLPPLHCSTSLLTFPLTHDLPFTRVTQPPILHNLHLTIPAWAQNPL